MEKKGFTLVELLAVIVILAVIALIATPMILGVIDNTKKGALKDSAYGLMESADIYFSTNAIDNEAQTEEFLFENGKQVGEKQLSYKGRIEKGSMKLYADGKKALCITDGKYIAVKNINDDEVKVTTGRCSYNSETDEYETVSACQDLQEELDELKEELNVLKSKGDAQAEDIKEGKTAVVQGELITGTLKENVPTGAVTYGTIENLVSVSNYEVELGFKPVYVQVAVLYGGSLHAMSFYDERIDKLVHKMGPNTSYTTVGLPTSTERAIYDSGFRVDQSYEYGGWTIHYIALKKFPES